MRTLSVAIVPLLLSIMPACALQPTDTMAAWRAASSNDRTVLLDKLFGKRPPKDGERASLRQCIDDAAAVPEHGELSVAEVAKACASSGRGGQPV